MQATTDSDPTSSVLAALCVDSDALDRFGAVLRYLLIGLIDQAVSPRLLSADPRVEQFRLGPVQTILHERMSWPMRTRRFRRLVEVLGHQPPTVLHAMSHGSYATAAALATTFDADLVLHVSSRLDCDAIAKGKGLRVGRYVPVSAPLRDVLVHQLGIDAAAVELVAPGILAQSEVAAFADPLREPTVLCTAALTRQSGVDLLIRTMHELRERGRPGLLFLLGEGPAESRLRRMVRDKKLSSVVTFAHPLGDSALAMRCADILARPCADDAFNVDTLQAMGSGMLVVAVANASCDHLHDQQTAVVCEKPTTKALTDALEQLLADPAAARRIAARGLAYVKTNHSMSAMGEATAQIYRSLALARATFPIKE